MADVPARINKYLITAVSCFCLVLVSLVGKPAPGTVEKKAALLLYRQVTAR